MNTLLTFPKSSFAPTLGIDRVHLQCARLPDAPTCVDLVAWQQHQRVAHGAGDRHGIRRIRMNTD